VTMAGGRRRALLQRCVRGWATVAGERPLTRWHGAVGQLGEAISRWHTSSLRAALTALQRHSARVTKDTATADHVHSDRLRRHGRRLAFTAWHQATLARQAQRQDLTAQLRRSVERRDVARAWRRLRREALRGRAIHRLGELLVRRRQRAMLRRAWMAYRCVFYGRRLAAHKMETRLRRPFLSAARWAWGRCRRHMLWMRAAERMAVLHWGKMQRHALHRWRTNTRAATVAESEARRAECAALSDELHSLRRAHLELQDRMARIYEHSGHLVQKLSRPLAAADRPGADR